MTVKRNSSAGARRPNFGSAECWLQHYLHSVELGQRPWEPLGRLELLLADDHGILEIHPEWIPNRLAKRLLGLPDDFGRRLEPYDDTFKERFLETINTDPAFALAMVRLMNEES